MSSDTSDSSSDSNTASDSSDRHSSSSSSSSTSSRSSSSTSSSSSSSTREKKRKRSRKEKKLAEKFEGLVFEVRSVPPVPTARSIARQKRIEKKLAASGVKKPVVKASGVKKPVVKKPVVKKAASGVKKPSSGVKKPVVNKPASGVSRVRLTVFCCPGTTGVSVDLSGALRDQGKIPDQLYKSAQRILNEKVSLDGTYCVDAHLDSMNLQDRLRKYFLARPRHTALYIIYWVGHGYENGNWVLANNTELSFETLNEIWQSYHGSDDAKLLVVMDSCHSGAWVDKCRRTRSKIAVISGAKASEVVDDEYSYTNYFLGKKQRIDSTPQSYIPFSVYSEKIKQLFPM